MEERNKLLNEINVLREQLELLEEENNITTLEERESIRNEIRRREQKIKNLTEEPMERQDVIMETDKLNISGEPKLSDTLEALEARLELLEEENDYMTLEERESIRTDIIRTKQKMKEIELETAREENQKEEVAEEVAEKETIIEEKVLVDEIIKKDNLDITEKEKLSNTVKALNAQLELLEEENDYMTLEERESIRTEIAQAERRLKKLEQTVEEQNKEQNKLELSQEETVETQKIQKQQEDAKEIAGTIEELKKVQNQLELSEAEVIKMPPVKKQEIVEAVQEEQGYANRIKELSETVEERFRMQNQAELSEAEFPRIEEMKRQAAKALEEKKRRQAEIEKLTKRAKESLDALEQNSDIIDVKAEEIFDEEPQTPIIESKTEIENKEDDVIDLTEMINAPKTTNIPEEGKGRIIDLTDVVEETKLNDSVIDLTDVVEETKLNDSVIDLTDVLEQKTKIKELEKVQKQGLMSLLIGLLAKIANKCKDIFKKKPKELMEAIGIKETERITMEEKFRNENRLELSQIEAARKTLNTTRDKVTEREEER